jgi:prepilin signal peptidase PulO-like enzyme (type II secretory pathway)
MATIERVRAQPAVTADRVSEAWASAHTVTRRCVLAACLTSGGLAVLLPGPLVTRVALLLTGVLLAIAALVDVHEHKLPNRLLASALAVTVAGSLATFEAATIVRTGAGLLIGGGLLLLVRLVRGVGMGDVKMAGVVGASTASFHLLAAPAAIAVAAFAASAYAVAARRQRLVLGPALWLGWASALLTVTLRWWS